MSDLYWHITDPVGKKPAEILKGLLDDDSRNYQKAGAILKTEISLLDEALALYIEVLLAAYKQHNEWKDNAPIRASLAMAQSALNYFLLARHGVLLGYYPEVRSLLRDSHERVSRCELFRWKPEFAQKFLKGRQIKQEEVDVALASIFEEEQEAEVHQNLRQLYKDASQKVHPNLESFEARDLGKHGSDKDLGEDVGKEYNLGGMMGGDYAAIEVMHVVAVVASGLTVLIHLVREESGAFDRAIGQLRARLEEIIQHHVSKGEAAQGSGD